MLKIFLLLHLLQCNVQDWILQVIDCECPQVTNLQVTGQTIGSPTISWSGNIQADAYIVKYSRQEDSYTSSDFSTCNTSFTFSGLAAGSYIFSVAAECNETRSEFIVTEDIIIE